jgi:hypothetical protein
LLFLYCCCSFSSVCLFCIFYSYLSSRFFISSFSSLSPDFCICRTTLYDSHRCSKLGDLDYLKWK